MSTMSPGPVREIETTMDRTNQTASDRATKIGAMLFALWGVLHLWVGYEGVHQYLDGGAPRWRWTASKRSRQADSNSLRVVLITIRHKWFKCCQEGRRLRYRLGCTRP